MTASSAMNLLEKDSYFGLIHDDHLDEKHLTHRNFEIHFTDGNLLLGQQHLQVHLLSAGTLHVQLDGYVTPQR